MLVGMLLLASMPRAQDAAADRFWHQWRGPYASGVSRSANPPLEWSEKTNIRWKVEIPGRGSGSPVVWGDRVFVLTAVPAGAALADSHAPLGGRPRRLHRFVVMAIDRKSGRTIWERTAREEIPHEGTHPDNGTWASSSAITDGEHVVAFFESRGSTSTTWTASWSGRRISATRGCATSSARDDPRVARQSARGRLGPSGRVLHHGTRQAHRQRDLAGPARGNRFVGHAARRRACGPRASDRPAA